MMLMARFEDSRDAFYREIMNGSMLFQGLTDQTLGTRSALAVRSARKHLERIDVTARIIEMKFNIVRWDEPVLEDALRNIHWMAVLRSCCSIEAYRRHYLGDMDPFRVASFLVLERGFPAQHPALGAEGARCHRLYSPGSEPIGHRSRRTYSRAALKPSSNTRRSAKCWIRDCPRTSRRFRRRLPRRRWPSRSRTSFTKDPCCFYSLIPPTLNTAA